MNKKQLIIFNAFDYGSTGVLCNYLKETTMDDFEKTIFICSNKPKNNTADYYLYNNSSKLYRKLQSIKATIFNSYGFIGKKATLNALEYAERKISKDNQVILSVHQIESSFFDFKSLLKFAHKVNARIYITLHDCWFFTGKCPYFDISKCEKWKHMCDICPNKRDFPTVKFKKIKSSYKKKIDLMLEHKDIITFVCPSQWIADRLEESPLKAFKHSVIHNGIKIYETPSSDESDSKVGLIAAAHPWSERKGLKYLKFLSNNIDYKKFSLTIVGVENSDGFSKNTFLYNVISRERLFHEFARNDYFLNPTLEDNFPTTNIEALSCGLKIISFNSGGSCESFDKSTGISISEKTEEELLRTISTLGKNNDKGRCINRAKMYFSKDIFVTKYYNLFRNENNE